MTQRHLIELAGQRCHLIVTSKFHLPDSVLPRDDTDTNLE
jgi:hypothetical protein